MQSGGAAESLADVNAGPAKRMRRPSVRLHQPYYENPGHRKLQRQWKALKKDPEGAKKPRSGKTATAAQAKRKKNDGASESSKGEMDGLNFDDDVAIGNWKSFNVANKERDFKRKRVRPSSAKKWSSPKPLGNEDDEEIERIPVSSGGESKPLREGEGEGGEGKLGANGIDSNLVVEDSESSSPNSSFGNCGRSDHKLSDGEDDDNGVGVNKGMEKQMGFRKSRDSNVMRGRVRNRHGIVESDEERDGVRVWLNQLGLGKYVALFKVHEVDDEVLPFLTLEDLKDMGVNAVGSRRKMYASIEKLGKGFQ